MGLRNHRTGEIVNDEQLFGNAGKLFHNEPDLIDARHLPQVDVDHQHAMRPDPGAVAAQHPGHHGVLRFEHGANRRQLRRFVCDKVDEHSKNFRTP